MFIIIMHAVNKAAYSGQGLFDMSSEVRKRFHGDKNKVNSIQNVKTNCLFLSK